MSTPPPVTRDFARRLIALESARGGPPGPPAGGAARVCDRLRAPLARLAGAAGYRALLSRALALAKAEVASLSSVQVGVDGSLEGFGGAGGDDGAAVVAHLLGLLATLIGEPLTRHLVLDAWPDAAAGETDGRAGGRP
jgi:hypothetical protein